MGGHEQIRVLKDLDLDVLDRDVLVVEDVVDTGLTLNYLVRTFELRRPRSINAVRCSTGRTGASWRTSRCATSASWCPQLFVGDGFDLEERWRQLPDLRLLRSAWTSSSSAMV